MYEWNMNDYRRYGKPTLTSAAWWVYVKYGVLILLAAATAYVVFVALTK